MTQHEQLYAKKDSPLFSMATKPLYSGTFLSLHCNLHFTNKNGRGQNNGQGAMILAWAWR